MIDLINISKTYKTKKTSPIDALKDINLTLPEKGIVFILGQSGSGKTTLMNIIGGLDTPTSGEMIFLDKKFTKENQKELEDYRNKYIGFVFQDYNVISELNVRENLMLGMTFQSTSKTDEKVSEVLAKVLLKDYEERYPSELSGGQLQRIAIARSFMKDSKILLADEPTGNLDESTGDEIMKVLLEVSKAKLVIVVTHNEEVATKYGKRIIRLKDGIIDSDSGDNYQLLSTDKYDASDKRSLNNVVALKMGLNNLGLKKLRLIITVFLMLIAFTAIALTLSSFSYHYADPHAKLIKTRGYEYFNISNLSYYDLKAIENNYPQMAGIAGQRIKTKKDVEKYGFELYPESIELDENSYYISETLLHKAYGSGLKAIVNDVEITLEYGKIPFIMLIGGEIKEISSRMKIAGIFRSPFREDPKQTNRAFDDYIYYFYATIFVSENRSVNHVSINSYPEGDKLIASCLFGDSKIDLEYISLKADEKRHERSVVGKDEIIVNTDLADNEIYLTFDLYAKIFKDNNPANYYISGIGDNIVILNELKYIGEKIGIEIYDVTHKRTNTFWFNLKGVEFDESRSTLYMNRESFNQPEKYAYIYDLNIKTSSIENVGTFLRDCVNKYGVKINTPVSNWSEPAQENFEYKIETVQFSMLLISGLLVIIAILQTIALISQGITARRKEIGILKALGARNRDIRKIFIYENLILVIPITILAIVASIIFVNVINVNFVAYYSSDYTFLYYKPYVAFATLGATLVIGLLATLIPLYRINKMKPVDAIKN